MKYREINALYKEGKYNEALEGFKEFLQYYDNINATVLWKALDCCIKLSKYKDGNEIIIKYIDKKDFPHERVNKEICCLYKNYFGIANENEKKQIINNLYKFWEVSEKKFNNYFFTYGNLSRKSGKADNFIRVVEESNDLLRDRFVKSTYLWCIYDRDIKDFIQENSNTDEIKKFYESAKYITENCSQLNIEQYNFNPYVITIIKVVRVIRNSNNVDYLKIQEWLLKLNVEELPYDNEIQFTLENGRQCEKASSREIYYYLLAKAYEATNKYKECIIICEQAQKEDIKWHYRNRIWIQYRKLYCKCIIPTDKNNDISNFKIFVEDNKFWYMYAKLADVYFRNRKHQEALYYGCKAFDIKEEGKKLVNLFLDLSYYFEANNKIQEAKMFLNAYLNIRIKQNWSIPYEEKCRAINYGIEYNTTTINIRKLNKICTSYITNNNCNNEEYYKGKIIKFISNNKSGFIQDTNGNNIFFNKSDIQNSNKSRIGDNVKYKIGKNSKGNKAIEIYIME